MLHLIFSPEREFLGEVITEHGALKRLSLNQAGEGELGAQCEVWQTRGLSVRREILGSKPDGSREIILYFERVQPRTPQFENALAMWAEDTHYLVVGLDDMRTAYWEAVLNLPFENTERFALLFALKQTPDNMLGEWQRSLNEADLLARHEISAKARASAILQKRISPHLKRVFKAPVFDA